jgi:hypothetical protein
LGRAGKINVQVGEDASSGLVANHKTTFAAGLEWMGEFGPVMPLVQAYSYDHSKAMHMAFGVKLHTGRF